jgi:hypothetical protein
LNKCSAREKVHLGFYKKWVHANQHSLGDLDRAEVKLSTNQDGYKFCKSIGMVRFGVKTGHSGISQGLQGIAKFHNFLPFWQSKFPV